MKGTNDRAWWDEMLSHEPKGIVNLLATARCFYYAILATDQSLWQRRN